MTTHRLAGFIFLALSSKSSRLWLLSCSPYRCVTNPCWGAARLDYSLLSLIPEAEFGKCHTIGRSKPLEIEFNCFSLKYFMDNGMALACRQSTVRTLQLGP